MQQFVRGQRAKISAFSPARKFEVSIALQSPRLRVFDFVCFGVDDKAQLTDDRYMVFFNQKSAPDYSIQLAGLSDQSARFEVNLDKVPPSVARLVFTASIDGTGAMRDLQTGTFQMQETEGTKPQVMEYRFSGSDFSTEGALMLGELYRKDGEWRFWAQGQGFAGDLRALLKHFGGQEDDSTTTNPAAGTVTGPGASPTPNTTSTAPPTPLIPPPLPFQVSPPAQTTPTSSVPLPAGSLQKQIASTGQGETLTLIPGEYQGPLYLDRPIAINGRGAAIWAHNGPVVVINSSGVELVDLDIEATAPDARVTGANVALRVAPGAKPKLENVRTRGEIEGVAGVEGTWKLPQALDLGEFAPRASNSFRVHVEVPQACELKTTVAGVSFVPKRLGRGANELEIVVENIGADTFLAGIVEFQSGGVARTVALSGRSARAPREAVCGRVLNAN